MADPLKTAKRVFDTLLSKADPAGTPDDKPDAKDPPAQVAGGKGGLRSGRAREDKNRISRSAIFLDHITSFWSKSHKLPTLFLSVFVLLGCEIAHGTQIITVVTRDRVVLAADSLSTRSENSSFTNCKIHHTAQFYWADAGLDSDTTTGYSVERLFQQGIAEDAPRTLDRVGSLVIPALEKELPILKKQRPDFYEGVMKGGAILDLTAVRLSDNGIEAYEKAFYFVRTQELGRKHITGDRPTTCSLAPGQQACMLVTNQPQIVAYVGSHPDIWNGDIIGAIDRLMQVAQHANPQNIGPPISILAITRQGPRWLRQNNCPDIR